MGLGFGWIGKIFKFFFNTLKTFSGDEGRDSRIESKIKHTEKKIKTKELDSQIDLHGSYKENEGAISSSEKVIEISQILENKIQIFKSEVDAYISNGDNSHLVKGSKEKFDVIIDELKYIIETWDETKSHMEKSSSRMEKNINAHKDALKGFEHEKNFIRQETRVLKRIIRKKETNLHAREKSAILVRRRNIYNEIVAFNEKEIQILNSAKEKIDELVNRITTHLEKAEHLEKEPGSNIKSWKTFSKYLGKLDVFFYQENKKLILGVRIVLSSEKHRMEEFAAASKKVMHKFGDLSVLQKEYDSLLIQEQEAIQEGETEIPKAA